MRKPFQAKTDRERLRYQKRSRFSLSDLLYGRRCGAEGSEVITTDNFMKTMCSPARKIAVTGHFGSGKTEFAVSLAMALAGQGCRKLALADMDIENPYFRSRERMEMLTAAGVRVYSDPYGGRNGSELQTIDSAIRAPLEDPECRVICDMGGDFTGAMVLNQFGKYFREDSQLLCVINRNRPGTDTVDKALFHLRSIESATGLTVTGLISNSHFIRFTTAQDVLDGWDFARQVGEVSGVPVLCACCMKHLVPQVSGHGFDVFPIGMYMRDSYLDKEV